MNYVGIDLWDKRCWLAYSNMWFIFTLDAVPRFTLVSELKKLLKEKDIWKIVIGMPYDLYGKNLKQLEKTQKFIIKLKQIFKDAEIIEMDERFTTFEAIWFLNDFWNKKEIMEKKDSMSAYLILERYLSKK